MKKLFLCLLSFFILASISFSQDSESVSQVILPIDVYVGDHAEIRYTFRSAIDFFPGETGVEHKDLETLESINVKYYNYTDITVFKNGSGTKIVIKNLT